MCNLEYFWEICVIWTAKQEVYWWRCCKYQIWSILLKKTHFQGVNKLISFIIALSMCNNNFFSFIKIFIKSVFFQDIAKLLVIHLNRIFLLFNIHSEATRMSCNFKVGDVFESLKVGINPIQVDVLWSFKGIQKRISGFATG